MSFGWNAWSPINFSIDLAFLALTAAIVRRLAWPAAGTAPSRAAFSALLRAAVFSLAPWFAAGLLLGGILGLSLIARVGWTAATVGFPAVCIALLFRWRRPWLVGVALAMVTLKLYGEVWCPNDLEVQTVRLELPGLQSPLKVVHLSDLQTDDVRTLHLKARDAANAFDPDVIAFTGDVLNHRSLIPRVVEYLKGFKKRQGAYFVTGNVDDILPLAEFCRDSGFECLDGKVRTVSAGGSKVAFLGLGLHQAFDDALLDALVSKTRGAAARVVLSHYPDTLFVARHKPVDLLLAGHTHGGQVCLPWTPIVTLSGVPRKIAAGGLHRVDRLNVLVSRGLGWEGHVAPRVRLFARPHLVLLELAPAAASPAPRS